jgi:hypothetical protein
MAKGGHWFYWVFSTGYQAAVCGSENMSIVGDKNFVINTQGLSQNPTNSMPSYVTFKGILFKLLLLVKPENRISRNQTNGFKSEKYLS